MSAEIPPKHDANEDNKTQAASQTEVPAHLVEPPGEQPGSKIVSELKATGKPVESEQQEQRSSKDRYKHVVDFIEEKGKPIGWLATIAVPIVLAFYAYKADQIAVKQHEQTMKQTSIQESQKTIAELQNKIQETQTQLARLQYDPNFVLRVNSESASERRVIDIYNLGATVRTFEPILYSSVRVDWELQGRGRRTTTYFGFVRGLRSFEKLQPQVVAQFTTDLPTALIASLNTSIRLSMKQRLLDQWVPVRIQQMDWIHYKFMTRVSEDVYGRDDILGDTYGSNVQFNSIGEAARQSYYYDGTVTMLGDEYRFSDFLIRGRRVGDQQTHERFLLDYMKNAQLNCPAISHPLKQASQARTDVVNAIEKDVALDERFFETIQSPARCRRANFEVIVDGAKYSWKPAI